MTSSEAIRLDPVRPPTADELVCDDGEPMETWRHLAQMELLIRSLELGWEDRSDFYVGGNMFLYFSLAQTKKNDFRGPDVFVVLDTERHRERKAWVVWEEGGRTPDVIIELLSESTEQIDRGEKMRIYSKVLRVGEYFLFDPWTKVLEGYRLERATRAWRKMEPDARGWLRSEQLELWLGTIEGEHHAVKTDWLRWIADDGHVLPTNAEVLSEQKQRANEQEQRANEQEQRANEQEQRANEQEQRAAALQAELDGLKKRLGTSG